MNELIFLLPSPQIYQNLFTVYHRSRIKSVSFLQFACIIYPSIFRNTVVYATFMFYVVVSTQRSHSEHILIVATGLSRSL